MLDSRLYTNTFLMEAAFYSRIAALEDKEIASVETPGGEADAATAGMKLEYAGIKTKLYRLMEGEVRAYLWIKRCAQGTGALLAALFSFFLYTKTLDANAAQAASYLIMPAWLLGTSLLALLDAQRIRKHRLRRIIPLLSRYDVTESVGLLAELLSAGGADLAPISGKGLAALLPKMAALRIPSLSRKRRACLYRALSGCNANVILALLNALEKSGEPEAIVPARRLTECPHWIAESARIRRAAVSCLAALEARAEAERARQTLLRPLSDISDRHLLRPAGNPILSDSRQLLRASASK